MIDRYSRQTLFPGIGEEGQKKLSGSSVVIVGCGALGTVIASTLVRAGVGRVKIIDRDLIEYHNLQRQVLYDEEDVKRQLPKAVAAERHLRKVNSSVEVEGVVADVNYSNIENLISGADVVLDGLDNVETRYIVNDACLKHEIPWIYGGAISAQGMTMNVIKGVTPCFRCLFPSPPPPGVMPTCDTAGVIGPAPAIVASLQSTEAIKILVGTEEIRRDLIYFDLWQGSFNRVEIKPKRDCPACQGKYDFLQPRFGIRTTILCGQCSVQVVDPKVEGISLEEMAKRLESLGEVRLNESILHFDVDGHKMAIFPDGRVILRYSFDESLARELYVKYIEDKQEAHLKVGSSLKD